MRIRVKIQTEQNNHLGFFASLLAFYIAGGVLICAIALWSS